MFFQVVMELFMESAEMGTFFSDATTTEMELVMLV
jgi:hypothetical protein